MDRLFAIRSQDAALGAVYGALAGDAAGAVLEFMSRRPTHNEVDRALTFPGGGPHGVKPGQITDDGELTLTLLHALAESPEWSLDRIAGWYGRWLNSRPFDIGGTTRAGLAPALGQPFDHRPGLAALMQESARLHCMGSKANGSLMRCAPIGVWGARLDDELLAACARADSSLTHPNPSCGDAVAAYTLALAHLVRAPGDRAGAWTRAHAWGAAHACAEVREWLAMAERDAETDCLQSVGFVMHGFVLAFRMLRREVSWEEGVRTALLAGGDTDTNACIVGGLLGGACTLFCV